MNYDSFLKEKQYTYFKLQLGEAKTNRLIISSLLIGFTHDLCKKGDYLFVNNRFIDDCSSKLIFKEENHLDSMTKFDLIRNKLAHGDYYIKGDNIKISYYDKEYEISIESIVSFAKEISNYYKYMNNDIICKNLLISDGIIFEVSDTCKKQKRTRRYHSVIKDLVSHFKLRLPLIKTTDPIHPYEKVKPAIGKKFNISSRAFDLELKVIGYTDKKRGYIENYNGNALIYIFEKYLSSEENTELVDAFIKFYTNYIYGLDSLLKSSDHSLHAFENDEMFDFSNIVLDKRGTEKNDLTGSIKQYNLNNLYKKMSVLTDEYHRDDITEEKRQQIEDEINRYITIITNPSIQRIYDYSDNRSEIEHVRCSVMHGNCFLKTNEENEEIITFTDKNKDTIVFKKEMSTRKFIEFVNNRGNLSEIENHISKR